MRRSQQYRFYSPQLLKPGLPRTSFYVFVVISVLVRLLITAVLGDIENPMLWEYGTIAQNLANGGVFALNNPGVPSAFMPPGYGVIIAGIYELFGTGLGAHVLLALVLLSFAIAIPFLVGWIGEEIWGSKVGFLAFSLALIWPPFLSMSGRLHPIPIYTALQIAAVGAAFATGWPYWKRGLVAGVLLGLYGNFRFEAPLILLTLYPGMVKTEMLRSSSALNPWPKRLLIIALPFAMFAFALGPWFVRNSIVFDRPIVGTSGGYNLLRGHHAQATGSGRDLWPAAREDGNTSTDVPRPHGIESLKYDRIHDELIADSLYRDAAVKYIRSHPRDELRLFGKKAFYFLVTDFTHPFYRQWALWVPSLLALIIGLAHWLRTGIRDPRQRALWMLFLIQLGVVIVFFVLPRFRISVDFVPLLFASAWLARTKPLLSISRLLFSDSSRTEPKFSRRFTDPDERNSKATDISAP